MIKQEKSLNLGEKIKATIHISDTVALKKELLEIKKDISKINKKVKNLSLYFEVKV